MHAFWEERRPGLGVIRVGKGAREPGDGYEIMLLADAQPGPYVELIGLDRKGFTRAHHDAIGLCLLRRGFLWWQRKRYKNGVEVPMLPQRIHLSSTFIKELAMSIEQAHTHAQKALGNAIAHATKAGFQDFAAALTALGSAADAGMPAAQGADLSAQGDAVRNIFVALQAVQEAGLAIDKKHAIHGDVLNVFNAMENVANQIHAANKARLHAALSA